MESTEDIIEIMQQLHAAHEDLLMLEYKKKEALIQSMTDDLIRYLHEQTKMTKRISTLEQSRLQRVQHWFNKKGIQNGSMSDLIKLTSNYRDKERLETLGADLQKSIEEIRNLSQLNQQLIEQSLTYIDFTLRLVTDEPERFSTYEREERIGKQATDIRSFFDSRA